jgi:glycosyltransferase involved in cell wall biosynthesis
VRIAVFNCNRRVVGGVERYLARLIPEAQRHGHQIALVYELDAPFDREIIYHGESWCITDLGIATTLRKTLSWNPDLIFVNSFSKASLVTELMEHIPTVFFCHDYIGTCISGKKMFQFPAPQPCAREFGVGCLFQYYPRRCGGWSPLSMWNEFQYQTDRLQVLRKGRLLITASRAMRAEYLKHGFSEESVQHFPYVTDFSEPEDRTLPEEPWRLLFAGRMETLKGGDLLIEALPKAVRRLGRKLKLTLAGDGRARGEWQHKADLKMTQSDSLEIIFTGWREADELGRLFRETDLVVMPSIWPEPFGCSGLEPGQYQIPAVAFDVGGISDWLHEGVNGHLASGQPPTVAGLEEAIVRCLQEPSHYHQICRGARQMASDFTLGNHVMNLFEIFEYAIGAKEVEVHESIS